MAIIFKNNKYYCRFQIKGERHFYRCNGASNKTEALRIENAFKYKIQQIQNGVIARENKQRIKLKVLYDMFNQYSKTNKRGYYTDVYLLRGLKRYFPETMYADEMTYTKAEQYKQFLLTERHLKNATVNKYFNVLKKMYNLAVIEGLITETPLKNVKQLKEPNNKVRFLTSEEEKAMFEVINSKYPYIKPIVICALHTGMRKSEVLNLKWCNIDMEYRFIELLETKSGKSRRIPISNTLYDVLNTLPKNNEYVFINPNTNKPYTDIHKAWYNTLKLADIKNFRFHDLRHTVATRLTESNIDLVVVKEILGHSKIETTMRYAHAVPKRKVEAITALDNYHNKIKSGYKTDTELLMI